MNPAQGHTFIHTHPVDFSTWVSYYVYRPILDSYNTSVKGVLRHNLYLAGRGFVV